MEAKSTDVISRLESAVTAWSEELQSAHLDDIRAAMGDVVARVREMEQRLGTIESTGQDRESTERAVAELSERVNEMNSGRDWAAELNQLRDEVAALRSERASGDGEADLSGLRGELQELRDQMNDIKPTDDALVAEFAKVGMEVSQLRSALKDIGINQSTVEPDSDATEVETFELGEGLEEGDFEAPPEGKRQAESAQRQEDSLKVPDDALRRLAFDDSGHRRRLGDILTAANAITSGQLDEALERQSSIPTSRIGTILVELGAATELTIARVLSAQLQLPYVELNEDTISDEAVALMNPRLARNHQCIPVSVNGDTMTLAMANPLDLIAIEDVELATHKRVDPVVATQSQVAHCIDVFYGPNVEVDVDDAVTDLDEEV